jgi:CspA family cold shock protein
MATIDDRGQQSDGAALDNEHMISHGVVREWDEDQGFGVIDSPDTPGGCWTHFSGIVMDGYRCLAAGDPVAFTCEAGSQDGYDYRAVLVWPPGVEPGTPQR